MFMPLAEIARQFELGDLPSLEPRYNIAPTQSVAAIRADEAGQRSLAMLRWGLVPHWAKDVSIGNRLINARAETVAEKPAFRQAFSRPATSGDVRNLAWEPVAASRPAAASPVTRPATATPTMIFGPPTMMELIVAGTILPELALELHVYSSIASERFVRINSASYREGEALAEGPRVLSITADGVILDYRDQSFLLSAD